MGFILLYVAERNMPANSPPSLDFFRRLGSNSPLLTHHLHWRAMVLALSMAVISF